MGSAGAGLGGRAQPRHVAWRDERWPCPPRCPAGTATAPRPRRRWFAPLARLPGRVKDFASFGVHHQGVASMAGNSACSPSTPPPRKPASTRGCSSPSSSRERAVTAPAPSKARRDEIIDALRRGTVPARASTCWPSASTASAPRSTRSSVAPLPGAACSRHPRRVGLAARRSSPAGSPSGPAGPGFATTEVQISETETPLHHLETVYRRLVERLSPSATATPARFRSVVDGWFYVLEEDVLADGRRRPRRRDGARRRDRRADGAAARRRRPHRARRSPPCCAAYRRALAATATRATADGLLAWLGGQPQRRRLGQAGRRRSRATSTTSARCRSCRAC